MVVFLHLPNKRLVTDSLPPAPAIPPGLHNWWWASGRAREIQHDHGGSSSLVYIPCTFAQGAEILQRRGYKHLNRRKIQTDSVPIIQWNAMISYSKDNENKFDSNNDASNECENKRIFLNLLEFTWICLNVLELTWIYLNSPFWKKCMMDPQTHGRTDGQSLL